MYELTFNYKDEAFTNSLIIANGTGVEHRAVIQLITTHLDDVSDFGRVTFQMIPFETNGGIQKIKMCRLNEQQATFVISLMKNTKIVVAFKKELVKQFFKMREFIKTLVTARKDFPLLTENIKLLHENPKPYHFSNECDMINRLVTRMTAKKFREVNGIAKGESIRPYLTDEQLELMEKLQKCDIGLLVAFPDYEQRKRHLEWYMSQIQHKSIEDNLITTVQ
ncbi:MAG: Rha family transcriptional regulator [Ruminococcus sp.]|nr:Rha family transcriptional regulator [Ruminococcus sp.]